MTQDYKLPRYQEEQRKSPKKVIYKTQKKTKPPKVSSKIGPNQIRIGEDLFDLVELNTMGLSNCSPPIRTPMKNGTWKTSQPKKLLCDGSINLKVKADFTIYKKLISKIEEGVQQLQIGLGMGGIITVDGFVHSIEQELNHNILLVRLYISDEPIIEML